MNVASDGVCGDVDICEGGDDSVDSDGDGIPDFCDEDGGEGLVCDVDGNGQVDVFDLRAIMAARNSPASGPDDPRDADGDGVITANDARVCVLECTNSRCAP